MLNFVALRSEPIRRIGEGRRLEVETVEETGDSITSVVFANVGKLLFFILDSRWSEIICGAGSGCDLRDY